MTYKAVIFDLDGTAISNAQQSLPTKRLIDAIKAAERKYKFCAATGRPITNAAGILGALGLVDPCVISAGTEIIDPLTKKILWNCLISPEDATEILKICNPYDYELLINNELVGEGKPASTRFDVSEANVMYLMQVSPEDTKAIMSELDKLEGVIASEVPSWTYKNIDIHITNKYATKEHVITELLKVLGIKKEATIGVGDGNNDVHLFKAVGLKVAMGNATDLLKSQADQVIETVDNDGLAKFIEDLLR
ncbi:MAG TPA: HAD family hydrolase [Candidatus Saccharimonadales bacterium]